VGIMPGHIHKPGNVVLFPQRHSHLRGRLQFDDEQYRQSTCVGLAENPVIGTLFVEVLELFMKDPQPEGSSWSARSAGPMNNPPQNYQNERHQTGRRLYCRKDRATGEKKGPCRCHYSSGESTAQSKVDILCQAGVEWSIFPMKSPRPQPKIRTLIPAQNSYNTYQSHLLNPWGCGGQIESPR